jgi:threonine dehydrogenase-like Zn-dependent dehydrogenase
MRATVMHAAGDVRVEQVPDATIREPSDALVRVVRACICGSDLWPYRSLPDTPGGVRMGHEFLGVVEDVGADVVTVRRGDLVVAPFAFSDGTCDFCREGLHTSCVQGGFWGSGDVDGGQGEAARVPFADGTLVPLPVGEDDALLASLLTLSDVFATGHHAAVGARVREGATVAVVGDGAVGLCGVLAARRLGAERILLLGRHEDRAAIGRDFGATDVVPERGAAAVERVRELTGGRLAEAVLECVGTAEAFATASRITRPGGAIGRVGVPQFGEIPGNGALFQRNITVAGGVAPARAYVEELLPDVLDGTLQPGRVFDRTVGLDGVPDGYAAMDARAAIKVLIAP